MEEKGGLLWGSYEEEKEGLLWRSFEEEKEGFLWGWFSVSVLGRGYYEGAVVYA